MAPLTNASIVETPSGDDGVTVTGTVIKDVSPGGISAGNVWGVPSTYWPSEKLRSTNEHIELAQLERIMGRVYNRLGQLEKAREAFEGALHSFRRIGHREDWRSAPIDSTDGDDRWTVADGLQSDRSRQSRAAYAAQLGRGQWYQVRQLRGWHHRSNRDRGRGWRRDSCPSFF